MSNFASSTPTINAVLNANHVYGGLYRAYTDEVAVATTAANATSGSVTTQRFPKPFVIPSVHAALQGYAFNIYMNPGLTDPHLAMLEYDLGSLTVSGNSFSGSGSMPSKKVRGTSITTASNYVFVVITATLTATTPVLTITYTDQDGNGSATATMTLPTNALVGSAFWVTPHLASGDSAVRTVTNISISTGSAGTLKVYGGLPLSYCACNDSDAAYSTNIMESQMVPYIGEAGEKIAFYKFGATTVNQLFANIIGMPELL